MRLAACIPSLPTELVACLEKCGIRTDAELLFSSPVLDIFRRLPSGTVSLHDLTKYVELVAELTSAPGISGTDLLQQAQEIQESAPKFPSGIPELDELAGGFVGGHIYEISGDRQSGKTGLVLHVVLRHLAQHPQSSALWMDTTGEFSATRATEILSPYDSEAASTALERLQVSLVFDIDTAHELLDDISATIDSDYSGENQLRCLVVDTITPLLGPLLSAVSAQGHAIMSGLMRQLKDLAKRRNLSIFIINNATLAHPRNLNSAFESTVRKPALGPSFTFMSDATIWLCKYESNGGDSDGDDEKRGLVYVAEVFRSKVTVGRASTLLSLADGFLLFSAPKPGVPSK